jgi:hypothetical protein
LLGVKAGTYREFSMWELLEKGTDFSDVLGVGRFIFTKGKTFLK